MPRLTAPDSRRSFRIAIICALPLEAERVRAVFDVCWEDEGIRYDKAEGDHNAYTTGVIRKHNVVLVHMARMGSTNASAVAADLRHSFPGIQLALVVGICGVVPIHPQTKEEIVLGDVVISTSVIQYDFGRQYPNGFQRKSGIEDSLGRANPSVQSLNNMLQVRQNRNRLTNNLAALLQSESFQGEMPDAKYPGASRDRLYEPSYIHRHRHDFSCDKCSSDLENCSKSCDELGCEPTHLILRNRHSLPITGDLTGNQDYAPFIHFGRFGSANTVMKSGEDRDRIAEIDQVAAFEMEGAGVWSQHPTVVIKAACDYADSHKHKHWQAHAAAVAAACLKVFLEEWSLPDQLPGEAMTHMPVWHVPFDYISGFIGRTKEIRRLRELVFNPNNRRMAAIVGLGGIGKSRLAMEFASQIKAEYPNHSILWIEASSQLTFERDVLDIGKRLQIPGIEDEKADFKGLFKQWLSNPSKGKWLLIIDNADDEALWGRREDASLDITALAQYLPRTTHGSIIITTRSRTVATFLVGKGPIKLSELSREESIKMFGEALEDPDVAGDDNSMLAITEKLAGLPLALIQAASYINMTQESVQTYLRLLDQPEEERIKLLSKDFGDPSRYPDAKNPIATTWLISFDRIRKHHHFAAKVLSSMACFHEKNIPRSLLPNTTSEIDMVDAIAVLAGYSFVKRHAGSEKLRDIDELYDLHRLVQLAARNWLALEGSLPTWTEDCLKRAAAVFPLPNHQRRGHWIIHLPHAQRICDDEYTHDFPERYQLLEKMGLCFVIDGKYAEAVKRHSAVVQWRETNLGPIDPLTLDSYNNIGEALNLQGHFSAAEMYLARASVGCEESLAPGDPTTLTNMVSLASTYFNQGRWNLTEALLIQVIDAKKREREEDYPVTLTSMNNLAIVYSNQGRWAAAEELLIEVRERRNRVFGEDHPDTLTSTHNLASIFWNQGRWTEATELNTHLVETRKRVLGEEHPHTLTSMNNLAATYFNQNRLTQATELHAEVLETRKRVLGEDHPDSLSSMNNLATAYLHQSRLTEAEELLIQVVETKKRLLGEEHPDTLTGMNNLAMTYHNQGRWIQAKALLSQVLEARKKTQGTENPMTLSSMANLAHILKDQGRPAEAAELLTSCLKLRVKVLGPSHHSTQNTNRILSGWLGLQDATEDKVAEILHTSPELDMSCYGNAVEGNPKSCKETGEC